MDKFFKYLISGNSQELKYKQIINSISLGIVNGDIKEGDLLPSVNQLSSQCNISRDTVYKAYSKLKKNGLIASVPNRGYFVSSNESKVFMLLDTFKAYKEVLYHSFRKALPGKIGLDIRFHHYNINVFETAVNEAEGKYSKYVIMNFDNPRIKKIIRKIPKEKLLLIDWNIHAPENIASVYQDFGQGVYNALENNLDKIKKYQKFVFLYPEFTDHPKITVDYFEKFCKDHSIKHEIIKNTAKFDVKFGELYFLVSDRTLSMFLEQCQNKGLVPGKSAGVISYNETPMKKYVKDGITVISTDFDAMGKCAAEFVLTGETVNICIPTNIIVRNSL